MMPATNDERSVKEPEAKTLNRVRVLLIKDKVPRNIYELSVPSYCPDIVLLRCFFSKDKILKDHLEGEMMAESYAGRVSSIGDANEYILEVKPPTINANVRIKAVDEPRFQYVVEVESPTLTPEFHKYGNFFNSKELCDVILCVGDRNMHAHKIVLANKSPVFHAMLNSPCKRMTIKDVDYATMFDVLFFIYKGKIIEDAASDLFLKYSNLLRADNRYCVEGLKDLCESKLSQMLTTENALECLILADSHNSLLLKEKTVEFIVDNIKKIIKLPCYQSFALLHPSVLITLLQAVVLKQKTV